MWLTCLGCGIRSILLQVRAVLQPIPFQPLMRPDLRFQINLFHFLCQWKTRQVTTPTFKKKYFLNQSWLCCSNISFDPISIHSSLNHDTLIHSFVIKIMTLNIPQYFFPLMHLAISKHKHYTILRLVTSLIYMSRIHHMKLN